MVGREIEEVAGPLGIDKEGFQLPGVSSRALLTLLHHMIQRILISNNGLEVDDRCLALGLIGDEPAISQ